MKKNYSRWSPVKWFVLAMALWSGFCGIGWAGEPLKVGDVFPALEQFSLEGNLPNLKGKIVLIDFWASWCAPCKASFPVLQKLSDEYGAKGVVILGISVDEKKADMDKFVQKTKVTFPLLRDADHKLVARVDVSTMPSSIIVDREGKVCFVHNGFHGDKTSKEYQNEIEKLLQSSASK